MVAARERSVGHTPWKLIVEARDALRAATDVTMIPARDLELLKRRASGATFREMADEMGIPHDRVKQLYPEALRRLRHAIRDTPAAVHIFERFG